MVELNISELWSSHHPRFQLPPLWAVLYYEAMSGHHLLFAPDELLRFEEESRPAMSSDEKRKIVMAARDLVLCASYSEMLNSLAQLSFEQRRQIFYLYKNWLRWIGWKLRRSAH